MGGCKMKKVLIYLGMALLAVTACKKENPGAQYLPGPELGILSGSTTVFEAAGGTAEIVFDTETPVMASAERPWLTVNTSGRTVTLTAEPNTDIESRYSELIVISGDLARTLTIQQMGALTVYREQEAWDISAEVSEEYAVTVSVDAASGAGQYYLFVVPATDVIASGAVDDISLFLSLDNNGVARMLGENIYSGSTTFDAGTLGRGKYYAIAVGVEDDYVNYTYACTAFRVYYPYDRWLGVWEVTLPEGSGSWTVTQKEQDATVQIVGLAGEEYPVTGVFTESGGLTIACQTKLATTTGEEDKTYDVDLYGCTGEGVPDQKPGKVIMTLTLNDDKVSATVTSPTNYTGYAFFGSLEGQPQIWWGLQKFPTGMTKTADID